MTQPRSTDASDESRRDFLRSSSAAAASLVATGLADNRSAHAAGDDVIRVGLIGCGGRGTKAAAQAVSADPNAKLVAMGDAFPDRLEQSFKSLTTQRKLAGKIDVPKQRQFVGFDAYRHVTDNVDVVLLTTPPHFRPIHLKYAIDNNRHVFAEKPIATDAPGVRSVLRTCEEAKRKKLSVVSGLCLRYYDCFRDTVNRIHDGALGDIHTLQASDYRGQIWVKPRQPGWTDMYYQMRNWYYFTWLSGDFNTEQHVHFLDICAWVMKDQYPVNAVGMGGRAVRNKKEHGNIYDHFSIVYEYANGAKLFSNTRQIRGCWRDMSAYVTGSKGNGHISENHGKHHMNVDGKKWQYGGKHNNFYQTEHDELFRSIRDGKPINNGEYMAKSTMMAIMARMAAYTGQQITWDRAMNSKLDLSPPKYDWSISLPERPVAIPGVTKFV